MASHVSGYLLLDGIEQLLRNHHYEKRDEALSRYRNRKLELPCADEVKKAAYAPPIILHGEHHTQVGNVVDKEQLKEAAHKGELFLAIENVESAVFKDGEGKVYKRVQGIEAPESFLSSLLLSYSCNVEAPKIEATDTWASPGAVFIADDAPFAKQAWARVDKTAFKDKNEKDWAALYGDYVDSKDLSEAALDKLTERAHEIAKRPEGRAAMNRVLKQWAFAVADLIQERKLPHAPDSLALHVAHYLHELEKGDDSAQLSMELLVVEYRNQLMLDRFAKFYCENWKEGKPLHVLVGNAHAPGMLSTLKDTFLPLRRRDWVNENVQYRNSDAMNAWWDSVADTKSTETSYPDRVIHLERDNQGNFFITKNMNGRRFLLVLKKPSTGFTDIYHREIEIVGKPYVSLTGPELTDAQIGLLKSSFEREAVRKYKSDREVGPLLKEAGLIP